jgi:cytochrome P450
MDAIELYYDQYSYDIDDDPYQIWKRLRDEAPVWDNEKYNYWVLSRYDDVWKASVDYKNFSSAWGTVLENMPEKPGETTLMINNDPPYHAQLRKLVAARFAPSSVARLKSDIRRIVTGYLEPLQGREAFDFVQDFGRWIPMDVISSLMGIPQEDRRNLNQWADDMLHREDGEEGAGDRAMAAVMSIHQYLQGVLADRKANPREDFLTELARAEIELEDGSKRLFNERESFEFMLLLAAAGNETVARLLSNTGVLLARHPEQRQKLRDDPELIPRAVEEVPRCDHEGRRQRGIVNNSGAARRPALG